MLQRFFITFLVSIIFLGAEAQQFSYTHTTIKYPVEKLSPATLAAQLTSNATTDKQKVASIFRWITENIEYKVRPTIVAGRHQQSIEFDDGDSILKPLNERVSEKVLQDRVAFCEGYARLFSTLCSYASIKSEVITGYSRPNIDRTGRNFRSNHSWNSVYIDSAWHLLDATWASGYVTYFGDRFVRHYDDYFFLTPPSLFIRSHYPEDLQWTLLPDPPTLKEFEITPFKQMGFYTRHVKNFLPANGIINAIVGDTLHFEIEGTEKSGDLRVVDVLEVDSVHLTQVKWWEYNKPATIQNGNKVKAIYEVTNAAVKWLHLVYNQAVILRYKINIQPLPN